MSLEQNYTAMFQDIRRVIKGNEINGLAPRKTWHFMLYLG